MFQWNIIFSSKERIIARWVHPRDRYPLYPKIVDNALFNGKKVVIVGKISQVRYFLAVLQKMNYKKFPIILNKSRYFIYPDPDIDLLTLLGFRLNLPESLKRKERG
jgi:hypothetical protein